MKRSVLFLATVILLGWGLQSCGDDNNGDNNGGSGGGTSFELWVDLDLPSGLLWSDRNVGAEAPEDYGNYYAWGETAPKEVYDWSTYAFGKYDALTKYCNKVGHGLNGFMDNLTTLESSDDAAKVNFGGKARMPRDYEWQELIDNTTSTWTTRNGVYGCLFTASNGKSIFLPAAGYRTGSKLYGAGEYGSYWSSKMYVDDPSYALYLDFYSGSQYVDYDFRSNGFSVRAVRAN